MCSHPLIRYAIKALLITSALVHGALLFDINVLARIAEHPHLAVALKPLLALIGIAGVAALADVLFCRSCCMMPTQK